MVNAGLTPTLALLLAEMDGVADRLRACHVPDRSGYCRGCYLPQSGLTRWPCTLHSIATEAAAVIAERARR